MTVRERALLRAEELERRIWAGTDDVAYCIQWAAIHRKMASTSMPDDKESE